MSMKSERASSAADENLRTASSRRRPRRRGAIVLAMILSLLYAGAVTPSAMAAESPTSDLYDVTVGSTTTTLREGESVTYRMTSVSGTSGVISSDVVYPGDSGTITVTANKVVYHYAVDMSVPATDFVGKFSVTDLTSGFGGGSTPRSCSKEMCRRVA
ncbi:hypothetical protein NAI87_07730 [Clavibacter michiganensis subsp. michiganensis]|uniref:hypothetical protein n=1 Tax=Clavibacter michiganensis TaxID=28447 RepID=UPI00345BA98A